jgi:hypothetical protein
LSNPGALNLAPSKIVSDAGEESNILFLYADIVEVALDFCRQWGWPRFEKIKFEQAWDWLQLLKYPNTAVADSPASKACSAIIGLAGSPWLGPFELLSTSIVLESLLTNNHSGVSGQIKERLKKILGEPKKDKKWITTYYELRSKVIHGSAHMPRPHINIDFDEDGEQLYLYYATYVYRAIGIIIALLLKLIKNKSERFSFSEKVSFKKYEK